MHTPTMWTRGATARQAELSLSDEEMLDDAWSDDVSHSHERRSSLANGITDTDGDADETASSSNRKRSRRLLTQQQSRVLYQLLEKTHFPSTHVREAIAKQLGVSPRKVQVWFQNRRQVEKKKMMDAVQASKAESQIAYDRPRLLQVASQSQQSTMQTVLASRPGDAVGHRSREDERTQAWRDHTVRLALTPSHDGSPERYQPDQRTQAWHTARAPFDAHAANNSRFGARHRAMQSISRSVASLRIDVPGADPSRGAERTPMYRGPGSAVERDMLSSAALEHHQLSQLTPVQTRSFLTPTIVSSQRERHPEDFLRPRQPEALPSRGRSQTMAAPAHHAEQREATRNDHVRNLRGNLTLEWQEKQRQYQQRQRQEPAGEQKQSHSDLFRYNWAPAPTISPQVPQRHDPVQSYSNCVDELSPAVLARAAAANTPSAAGIRRQIPPSRTLPLHPHMARPHNGATPASRAADSAGRLRSASNPGARHEVRTASGPVTPHPWAEAARRGLDRNAATRREHSASIGTLSSTTMSSTSSSVWPTTASSTSLYKSDEKPELPPLLGSRKRSADHLGQHAATRGSPAKLTTKLPPIVEPCPRPVLAPVSPNAVAPPLPALQRDPRWRRTARRDDAPESRTSSSRASSSCSSSTSPPSSSSPPARPPVLPELLKPGPAQSTKLSPMDVRSIT